MIMIGCRSAKICYLARLFILYFRSAGFSFRLLLRLLTRSLLSTQNTLFQFLFFPFSAFSDNILSLSLSSFIYFHTFHINYIFFFRILLNCCYCNFTGKQEFSFSRSPFASRDVFPSSTQKKYCQFDCRSVFLTPVCFYIVFSFIFSIFFFII